MWWLLVGAGVLLSFGFLVDWWNKKNGITDFDPEENAKHVSDSERAYVESYMHNMKHDHHDNGGI